MKAFFFLAILCCFTGPVVRAGSDHDIHLSLSELRYNEQSGTFEVAIKIFIDDFEAALKKGGVSGLHIGTPSEDALADEHINTYLKDHFTINVDGVKVSSEFIGKEVSDDMLAVWCYVEFKKDVSRASKITLSNKILFELYPDQRNILNIDLGHSRKDYTILDPDHSSWSYSF